MLDTNRAILALTLAATLTLSGCIGSGENGLSFLDTDGTTGDVRVVLDTEGASEAGLAHVGLHFDGVLLHDTNVSPPEGYHALDVAQPHADVVAEGSGVSAIIANGSIEAGTYDQLMLRLAGADVSKASEGETDDHGGHEHGADGHDSADGGTAPALGAADVPINVTFNVAEDRLHQIKITLDMAASSAGETFQPVLDVVVTADGRELATATFGADEAGEPSTTPPAARMSVFAPNGDQIYEPSFTVEQGAFVNTKADAIPTGETARFSGTESEAVASGASIEAYAWDFDDGETATGATVAHAFDVPGVYEVEMTVEDTHGVTANHLVRVVVWGWTTTLAETTFEEQGDWTTSSGDTSGTTWALDGEGREDASAWHVGTHGHAVCPAGDQCPNQYSPMADATLTSPEFEIPSDWKGAGVEMFLRGASEACCDGLDVSYTIDGQPTLLGSFSGEQGWSKAGSDTTLDEAVGKTVQFEFHFASDAAVESGFGWLLDDLTIGGVEEDQIHKPELLDGGGHGHGGHDH